MLFEIFLISIFSYFLGAIPFSFFFAKLFSGVDVRKEGSSNVGATNVLVTTGKKRAAFFSVLFDLAKGFSAVFFARTFFGSDLFVLFAGFFVVLGHDFSLYLGFKGGKGVATSSGVFIAINPLVFFVSLLIYFFGLIFTRYLILSTLISLFASPILFFLFGDSFVLSFMAFSLFVLAVIAHRNDIIRIVSGKEKKIGDAVKGV